MKKINPIAIVFLLISLISPNLMAQERTNPLQDTTWSFPIDSIAYLKFTDRHYDIIFSVGGHFCRGDYIFSGNKLTLYYPNLDQLLFERSGNLLNWLFQGSSQTTFTYDPEYIDFDYVSSLRDGSRLLRNMSNPSPSDQKYRLSGVDVIKYDIKQSMVLILDNLRMREHPDINAATVTLTRYLVGPDESFTSHLVHKNSFHSFDAKTVKEDTIDGITAPWYRIIVILGEVFSEKVWVFGGYVKELPVEEVTNRDIMVNYYRRYYETLIEQGIISRSPYY